MRVEANREVCIGAGLCVLRAGRNFDQDPKDGLVVVVEATVEPDAAEAVRDAVDSCPSGAIRISES
jgi:ferredoxin